MILKMETTNELKSVSIKNRLIFNLRKLNSLRYIYAILKYETKLLKTRLLRKMPRDSRNLFSTYSLFRPNLTKSTAIKNYNKYKNKPRIVLFSAIAGNYDALKLPDVIDARMDYVLFTDQKVDGFGLFNIKPLTFKQTDSGKQVRYVKTQPSLVFSGYDIAVWIDANIKILGDIYPLIKSFENSRNQIACTPHPVRNNVYEEGEACIALKKGNIKDINKQLDKYRNEGFIHNDLAAGGLLFYRLDDEKCINFQKTWWHEIVTYSGRDQLSLNYSLVKNQAKWYKIMKRPLSIGTHPLFALSPHKNKRTK